MFYIRTRSVFDPTLSKSLVIEIRAGEGGDDSKNFVNELSKIYALYATRKGLKIKILSEDSGWFCAEITGKHVWNYFEQESGKHVVQRCPSNGKGKKHTSIVSVAVLPLFERAAVELDLSDVEIKTQRGSGPGGQHRNKTDTAVRAVHKPTGLQAYIDGRSQNDNKRKALQILAHRLAEMQVNARNSRHNANRQKQVDGGSRSGKIRTYNFDDGRVINHKNGRKTDKLKEVMKGKIELVL